MYDEYFFGKVAAHAYVDEMQKLGIGTALAAPAGQTVPAPLKALTAHLGGGWGALGMPMEHFRTRGLNIWGKRGIGPLTGSAGLTYERAGEAAKPLTKGLASAWLKMTGK